MLMRQVLTLVAPTRVLDCAPGGRADSGCLTAQAVVWCAARCETLVAA